MEPKISHHGRKRLGTGEGDNRQQRCRQGRERGSGRDRLEVLLREKILQVRVDVVWGRETGWWQQVLRRWAVVGEQSGCPQGQHVLQDCVQGAGG